ncbi:hypothetical protein N7486_001536 [Penicillium sp. IBT 16267x]|nr:hypothetical protein N7486_001536 [Penicillium sp. IBT 16267x]
MDVMYSQGKTSSNGVLAGTGRLALRPFCSLLERSLGGLKTVDGINLGRRINPSGSASCAKDGKGKAHVILVSPFTVIACILTFVVFAYLGTRRIQELGSSPCIIRLLPSAHG